MNHLRIRRSGVRISPGALDRSLQSQGTCWFWPQTSQWNWTSHLTGNQTLSADSPATARRKALLFSQSWSEGKTTSDASQGEGQDQTSLSVPPPEPAPAPVPAPETASDGQGLPAGVNAVSPWMRLACYLVEGLLATITLGIGWLIWAAMTAGSGQTPAQQVLKQRVIDSGSLQPVGMAKMFLMRGLVGGFVGGHCDRLHPRDHLADAVLGEAEPEHLGQDRVDLCGPRPQRCLGDCSLTCTTSRRSTSH